MAIRQARLEPLALSTFGHERMVKGPTAASKEQRIGEAQGDIVNYHHRMGGIGRHRQTARFAWNAFIIHNVPLGLPPFPSRMNMPSRCVVRYLAESFTVGMSLAPWGGRSEGNPRVRRRRLQWA